MLLRFAGFEFDPERGLRGPAGPIPLQPQDARLLAELLEADGRLVRKEDLVDRVWRGRAISDDAIFQSVRRLRGALGGEHGGPIQTVYGSGLRLAVPVIRAERAAGPQLAARNAAALLTSAHELAARRSHANLERAIDAAREATARDPGSVAAWCAIAEFQVMRCARLLGPPRVAGAEAVAAADRALQLEPANATALALRGWVRGTVERDPAAGLLDLDLSLRLGGENWMTHGLRAYVLVAAGRIDEAVDGMEAAERCNPYASWFSGIKAQYLWYAGRADDAITEARRAVERFPDIDISHFACSMITSGLGLHDEAVAAGQRAVELAPDLPLFHTALAGALARAGRRKSALACIGDIEAAASPASGVWMAVAWLALGQRSRALACIEAAQEACEPQLAYLATDPRLQGLRN